MIRLIPKILAAIVAVVLLVVGGLSVALPRLVNSDEFRAELYTCLLYTSPSPRDKRQSRMPSSA